MQRKRLKIVVVHVKEKKRWITDIGRAKRGKNEIDEEYEKRKEGQGEEIERERSAEKWERGYAKNSRNDPA